MQLTTRINQVSDSIGLKKNQFCSIKEQCGLGMKGAVVVCKTDQTNSEPAEYRTVGQQCDEKSECTKGLKCGRMKSEDYNHDIQFE